MTNPISGYVPPLLQRIGQAVKESPRLSLCVKITALFSVAMLSLLVARYYKGSTKPTPPANPDYDISLAHPTSKPSNGKNSVDSVSSTSSIFSLNFSLSKPEAPVAFYIASNTIAYYRDQANECDEQYWKNLTLPDGTPFNLSPKDMIVECRIVGNDPSSAMHKSVFPQPFILPASFLKEQGDGKTFKVIYKGYLIELQLRQQEHPYVNGRREPGEFLESAKVILEMLNPLPAYLVPTATNPYPFYTLQDGGFIFKAGQNGQLIQKSETSKLRDLKQPNTGVQIVPEENSGWIHTHRGGGSHPLDTPDIYNISGNLVLARTFIGGSVADVDIVLTPTHLLVYGWFEKTNAEDKMKISNEILAPFEWKHYFKELSYEEMQEKLLNSSISCKAGLLELRFGFRYPTDNELELMDYIPEWKLEGMRMANSVEFLDYPIDDQTTGELESIEGTPDDDITEWVEPKLADIRPEVEPIMPNADIRPTAGTLRAEDDAPVRPKAIMTDQLFTSSRLEGNFEE